MENKLVFEEIKYVQQCESTSLLLNNILNENSSKRNIILRTDFQTKGVGQKGNFWESEKGKNLLFSININFDNFMAIKQFYISAIVSLSIVSLLKQYLPNETINIKWPNDIYVGKKKIAGILIENSLLGNKIKRSIIGIGINVNQELFNGDAQNPTSLKLISFINNDIEELLLGFIHKFEIEYSILIDNSFDIIKTKYLELLYQKNKVCSYLIEQNQTDGIIRGIDELGFLNIEVKGQIRSFDIKEVKYLL